MTGKQMMSLQHPAAALSFVGHVVHEYQPGLWVILGLDNRGHLIYWDTNNFYREEQGSIDKPMPGRKTVFSHVTLSDSSLDVSILSNKATNKVFILLTVEKKFAEISFGTNLSDLTCKVSDTDASNVKLAYIGWHGELTLYSGTHNHSYGKDYSSTPEKSDLLTISHSNDRKLVLKQSPNHLMVIESTTNKIVFEKNVLEVKHSIMTPDGKHVLWTEQRNVNMAQVATGRLTASFTGYDIPDSLVVTPDGWFALLGMPDGRLFVLCIADPTDPNQVARIATVRSCNPGIGENIQSIVEKAVDNSSDESSINPLNYDLVTMLDMESEYVQRAMSRIGRSNTGT